MTCRKCNHDKVKKFGYCGRSRAQRYRCLSCRSTFVVPIERPLGNHTTDLDAVVRALELMMEGASVRSISRLTGLHIHTFLGLMVTAGEVGWYNFGRVNTAIRCTPAMQAGLATTIWTMRDLFSASI